MAGSLSWRKILGKIEETTLNILEAVHKIISEAERYLIVMKIPDKLFSSTPWLVSVSFLLLAKPFSK